MTRISSRRVVRETDALINGRSVVVSLEDPNAIVLWLKGLRRKYRFKFSTLFVLAVQADVDARRAAKRAAKLAKKGTRCLSSS